MALKLLFASVCNIVAEIKDNVDQNLTERCVGLCNTKCMLAITASGQTAVQEWHPVVLPFKKTASRPIACTSFS